MEKLQEIINQTEDFLSYLRRYNVYLGTIAKARLNGMYGSAIYDEDLRRECHELGQKVDELGRRVVDQDKTIRRYANRIDYLEKQLKHQQRINEELEYLLNDIDDSRLEAKHAFDDMFDGCSPDNLPFPDLEDMAPAEEVEGANE